MKRKYESVMIEISLMELDVIMASVPLGGNSDGLIEDNYGELL